MSRTNSGIHISGGTVHAEAMAAGDHAIAYSFSGSADAARALADLRTSLAALAQQVRDRSSELPDPSKAEALIDLANAEAVKEEPDSGLLLSILKGLGAAVGSVATLGTSVASIVETVSALTGG